MISQRGSGEAPSTDLLSFFPKGHCLSCSITSPKKWVPLPPSLSQVLLGETEVGLSTQSGVSAKKRGEGGLGSRQVPWGRAGDGASQGGEAQSTLLGLDPGLCRQPSQDLSGEVEGRSAQERGFGGLCWPKGIAGQSVATESPRVDSDEGLGSNRVELESCHFLKGSKRPFTSSMVHLPVKRKIRLFILDPDPDSRCEPTSLSPTTPPLP